MLRRKIDSFIGDVIKQDHSHARWLNTLSFLEHIGSRKMLKSLNSYSLTLELLSHITEETRHAWYLKKQLDKNFPKVCTTYDLSNLLGGKAADNYFQELDSYISDILKEQSKKSFLNYLYVTFTVETRALVVYQLYQKHLETSNQAINLTPLINEEIKHFDETNELLRKYDNDAEANLEQFHKKENDLFDAFIDHMKVEISNA